MNMLPKICCLVVGRVFVNWAKVEGMGGAGDESVWGRAKDLMRMVVPYVEMVTGRELTGGEVEVE